MTRVFWLLITGVSQVLPLQNVYFKGSMGQVFNLQQTNQKDNYGPFTVSFEDYSMCNGPKAANLTISTYNFTYSDDHSFMVYANVTFLADTRVDEIKVEVFNMKGNSKVPLWNYKVVKPCENTVTATLLDTINKNMVLASSCLIKKGTYGLEINISAFTKKFIGESFFYGKYVFKGNVLSKKGNIVCIIMTSIYSKKV